MTDQVRLPELSRWYEANIERTPTLSIVRCLFQGSFPREPCVFTLGKNWAAFEAIRSELGDAEFHVYIQCQLEAFKANRPGKKFYPAYCVEARAADRYHTGKEKIRYSGYHSFRSEIYRAIFPNECAALREYFRRWLVFEEGKGQEEPNWWNLKAERAAKSHPYWTYFSCTYSEAALRGGEFLAIWIAGKKRVLVRKLLREAHEGDRACIDALVFVAQQTSPLARDFILFPKEEFSLPYQVGVQFHALRTQILAFASPLKITVEGAT